MPQLRDTTETAYRTLLVSQKTHHRDLRDLLDDRFSEVRAKLDEILAARPRVATLHERWRALGPAATAIVDLLIAQTTDETFQDAQLILPLVAEGHTAVDLKLGVDRLVEANLVSDHPYAQGGYSRLTALGYLAARAVSDEESFRGSLLIIQDGFRAYGALPLDKLRAHSRGQCSISFIVAVCKRWESLGWIHLQDVFPPGLTRVSRPLAAMRDADPTKLVDETLRAFRSPEN
jgi:hypothetical protein